MNDRLREQVLADPTIPKPIRSALEQGLPLEEIRLDRFGAWWHAGQRVEHERICRLFHRSIERTEGGTYVLAIWHFTYPIVVEDTPLFVLRVRIPEDGTEKVAVELSDGSTEQLELEDLRLDGERLTTTFQNRPFEARFLRDPYHTLLDAVRDYPGGGYALAVGDTLQPLPFDSA